MGITWSALGAIDGASWARMSVVQLGVLGPTQVVREGRLVDLGTRKQRALLAALALYPGRAVSVDAIVDLLWGDQPPAAVTLQAYVANLRKALEPQRAPRTPATVLTTVGAGYAIEFGPDQIDAAVFASAVTQTHQRLGPVSGLIPDTGYAIAADTLHEAAAGLDAALRTWRGEPYLELDDAPDARAERNRLGELALVAREDRALARIWLGEQSTIAAELESLTAAHPLRERLWGLRALALARAGRQADALAVLSEVRRVLDDELGLEPSAELRALQTAVLRQDPALSWTATGPVEPIGPPPQPAPPASPRPARRPMFGRDDQLDQLVTALAEAADGQRRFAGLIGDPGIGKSRLATALADAAADRGIRVLLGRCSQDEGAPALWPWSTVLAGLDQDLGQLVADRGQSQFAVWEAIVAAVVAAARQAALVIILDDLHWADAATLRVLRLLLEDDHDLPLLVVGSWRPHPAPTGALADLIEMLGRAHALRIELTGLAVEQGAQLVADVLERPTKAEAEALLARTDGNPFFLVEYARLAAERGDLGALLAEPDPPTAVQDVLRRRLTRLPDTSQTVLRLGSVIGREFDLELLAAAADQSPDAVLDALEPAELAGLLLETGIDRFRFAHALVRDTAYAGVTASRRARLHARVAEALSGRLHRESELARHWLAAGPAHAAAAWRAAVTAARAESLVHAHEQRVEWLEAARVAIDGDPAASRRDRYDVLMDLVDAYRWTGRLDPLIECVQAAIAIGDELSEIELVAAAACAPTVGAIWQSAAPGQVHEQVVSALRRCLAELPAADGELRCRVMLSLANELYYGTTLAERTALVEQARAMAQRIGDKRLRIDADLIGFAAVWVATTAPERLAWASEALELAAEVEAEQALVVAATMRAVVLAELGEIDQMWPAVERASVEAARLHIPYGAARAGGTDAALAGDGRRRRRHRAPAGPDHGTGETDGPRPWRRRICERADCGRDVAGRRRTADRRGHGHGGGPVPRHQPGRRAAAPVRPEEARTRPPAPASDRARHRGLVLDVQLGHGRRGRVPAGRPDPGGGGLSAARAVRRQGLFGRIEPEPWTGRRLPRPGRVRRR